MRHPLPFGHRNGACLHLQFRVLPIGWMAVLPTGGATPASPMSLVRVGMCNIYCCSVLSERMGPTWMKIKMFCFLLKTWTFHFVGKIMFSTIMLTFKTTQNCIQRSHRVIWIGSHELTVCSGKKVWISVAKTNFSHSIKYGQTYVVVLTLPELSKQEQASYIATIYLHSIVFEKTPLKGCAPWQNLPRALPYIFWTHRRPLDFMTGRYVYKQSWLNYSIDYPLRQRQAASCWHAQNHLTFQECPLQDPFNIAKILPASV